MPCEYGELCYDFSQSEKFLNRKDVQKVLGVKPKEWKVCDWDVYDAMDKGDRTTSMLSTMG